MAEHRRDHRVHPGRNEPVEVQIMGSDFIDIFLAHDVSENGIGIDVLYKFEGCNIEDSIELIITFPHERSFKANGIIKHSNVHKTNRGMFGVEIISIQKGHEKDLKNYVKKMFKHEKN